MAVAPGSQQVTDKGVAYNITDWQLHYNQDKSVNFLFIGVEIFDPVRAPNEQVRAEWPLAAALLASFPQDEAAQIQAIVEWLDKKVDERHYTWITVDLPNATPAPLVLTREEIATEVLGRKRGEMPTRRLKETHLDRGTKPEAAQVEDPGRPQRKVSPLGRHRAESPAAPTTTPAAGPGSTAPNQTAANAGGAPPAGGNKKA